MTRPIFRSERDFQQAVIDLARLLGWRVYHPYDSRRSVPGYPDLTLVHPIQGRTLFRELKTATGRVSPAQRQWLDDLTDAGQNADVWRPNHWPDYIRRELETP